MDAVRCPLAEAEQFLLDLKGHYGQSEAGRAAAVALTHLQTARLWAKEASNLYECSLVTADVTNPPPAG